jgi:Protein of unknown function (DUF2799)
MIRTLSHLILLEFEGNENEEAMTKTSLAVGAHCITRLNLDAVRSERLSMRILGFVLALLCGCVLAGCAPISRDSCINDSAYDIGYAAAMDNADREDRLRDVSKICAKQGRKIDMAEYAEGFEAGIKIFCAPDNGYRWGLRGRSYNGICRDPAFGAFYEDGRRVFKIEQRRVAIRDRLSGIRDRLSGIAKQFDEDKSLSEEHKRQLRREEDKLLLERQDLLAEQRGLGPD